MVTLIIDADGVYYLEGADGLPHELVNQNLETLKQELYKLSAHSGQMHSVITAEG